MVDRVLERLLTATRWHPLVVAVLAGAIALPMLGWSGLSRSEGHRAIPGWAMLERGDFLRVELFEATYVRKPPGMPWAVAAASAVFGRNEFAARLPSAIGFIGMSVLAWWFGRRWFGARWGLAAGAAQALMPAMWPWARAAEIEGLHAGMTQAAALLVIDLCRPPAADARRSALTGLWPGIGLGLALSAMVALKGPSGLPAVAAAMVGSMLAWRSWRVVLSPPLGLGVSVALAIILPGAWLFARANADEAAVTQGVSGFLWDATRLSGVALLAPMALAAALPASLALLLVWGPDAARERREERAGAAEPGAHGATIAWALALSFLVCVGVYVLAGVSNHRYLLPAAGLLPPLAAYVARGAASGGPFGSARRGLARAVCLGHPAALVAVMIVAAAVAVPLQERSRARNSARDAGAALGSALPAGALVLADGAVDARPEVGDALRRACGGTVRWDQRLVGAGVVPAPGVYLLLRGDAGSEELARYQGAIGRGELREVARARAHTFEFVLLRAEDAGR